MEIPDRIIGRIAQLVEQLTLNQRVLGSSPSASTNLFNNLRFIFHKIESRTALTVTIFVTCNALSSPRPVETLARTVQAVTGDNVEIAWVDQGYTGAKAADAAATHGISLEVVKLPEAKRGFVLLPRRWVVERSFAWATKFRRLVKDYERYAHTLAGLHVVAFACLTIRQVAAIAAGS